MGDTVTTEIPTPLHELISRGIASRTQFWRWEKLGLRILRVGGKLYVRASELNRFFDEQDALARAAKGGGK